MLSLCFSRSTHIRRNSSECRTRFFATLQLLSAKCANNECLNLGVQSTLLPLLIALCAQRLSASSEDSPVTLLALAWLLLCSTPFGIIGRLTPLAVFYDRELRSVLNAFRHHRKTRSSAHFSLVRAGIRAQRLSASSEDSRSCRTLVRTERSCAQRLSASSEDSPAKPPIHSVA